MKLTDEQINAAAEVNLIDYCAARGIPLVHHNGETYRHEEYDSLKITGNKWRRFSDKTATGQYTRGNAVHFLMEYEGRTFREAVQLLLEFIDSPLAEPRRSIGSRLNNATAQKGVSRVLAEQAKNKAQDKPLPKKAVQAQPNTVEKTEDNIVEKPAKAKKKTDKNFMLPAKNTENKHVFAYLTKTRCIDDEIVREMFGKKLLFEDTYRNCVFVGYDKNNSPAFACKKGTNTGKPYTGDVRGSKKIWGWRYENGQNTVRVFEAPIDALSYMTLENEAGRDWKSANYLALSGVSDEALFLYMRNNKNIERVELCLDNDEPGQQAAHKIQSEIPKSIECVIVAPEAKDFNEDLKNKKKLDIGER